jgi:hypothetical protein
VFRPKKTRIKLYNILPLSTLLYSGENWTIKARDVTRVTAAEMKYMRRTARYTWTDHKTNTDIAKELNITASKDKLPRVLETESPEEGNNEILGDINDREVK